MKHAIMVIGHGYHANVLQKLIAHFDDVNIDFFIHWDKKFPIPQLTSKYSKIIFIPRISVNWGNYTQIYAEKRLLEYVRKYKECYNWVHLISATDIPLMTKNYFLHFFNKDHLYLGYVNNSFKERYRLSFWFPIDHIKVRNRHLFIQFIKIINMILHIDRLRGKNIAFEKGCNWFSIPYYYIDTILNYPHMSIFHHAFLPDETYLQTILASYKPKVIFEDDNTMAARYIDWNRGAPYVFGQNDILELKKLVNTKYAFARKVYDETIVDKIFNEEG